MSDQKQLEKLVKETTEQACVDSKELLDQIGVSPAAYAQVVLAAISTTPKILECSPMSIRRSIRKCAILGLLPDGDQAAIVPFKKTAQLVVGYKGQLDLIREAIPGVSIVADAVTDTDEFSYIEGLNPVLTHVRDEKGERCTEKNFRCCYAIAWMPGNSMPERVVMWQKDIEHIRTAYTQDTSTAWLREYAEQAKKTVLRRLGKKLPIRSGLIKTKGRDIGTGAFEDTHDDAAGPALPTADPTIPTKAKDVTPPKDRAAKTPPEQKKKEQEPAKVAEGREDPEDSRRKSFEEPSPVVDF